MVITQRIGPTMLCPNGQSAANLCKIENFVLKSVSCIRILYTMDFLLAHQRLDVQKIGNLGKIEKKDFERIIKYCGSCTFLPQDCWLWDGVIHDEQGKGHQHGHIWFDKRYVQVHRLMYHNFVENVPVYQPKGLIVLHKCSHQQNGRCINPWHMKLGTSRENTLDAMKENNLRLMESNEKNPMSKLPNQMVQEILALKNFDKTQKEIARIYGINPSQVSRYWNRKTRIQTENVQRLDGSGGSN
jgi:hypothetical protein